MTDNERLAVLKKNLQQMATTNDELLIHLLQQSGRRFEIMGIKDDGTMPYEDALIDMAAYLFRHRAKNADDTEMPRFLRKELNDLKLHQQGSEASA